MNVLKSMLTSYPSQNDVPNAISCPSQNDIPNDVDSEATLSDGEDEGASDGQQVALTGAGIDGFVEKEAINDDVFVGDDLGLIENDGF